MSGAPEMSSAIEPLSPPPSFVVAAGELGVEFEPGDLQRLGTFLALLLEANKTTNLTAIRDPDEAWTKHILDALTLLPTLAELPQGASVLDVGSGGGVPALPLAIVCPQLQFTLLEATGKKVEFLRRAIDTLGLANATVVQERAEQAGQDRGQREAVGGRAGGMREAFDAVSARAVGRLAVVAELTVPFAKLGGLVLLVKGRQANEELAEGAKAVELLGASHAGTVDTPTGRIVVLEKVRPTPRTYPRRDGEPKRAPLGARSKAEG
jgi:16S rRNA (guanine527-N7)-methyltransferase